MKKIFLLTGLVLVFISAGSQNLSRNCGTMDALQLLQTNDPTIISRMQQIEDQTSAFLREKYNQNSAQAVITIPVVFHIVYNTSSQNISDARVQAQINQLNLDFAKMNTDAANIPSAFAGLAANTGIQFCLAVRDPNGNPTSGIERRQTSVTSFGTSDNIKHYSTGGLDAWPSGSYLNFWSGNLSGGLLGYAQFPGGPSSSDGIVCLYSSIGSMLSPGTALHYDLGRTATHEVGHWVNLRHIWGDDGSNCTGSDLVGDTPNQAAENYGCPAFPRTDACSPSSPGVMYMNYMDYTYDNCMNMFTSGQSSRMNALFAAGGTRVSLLSSQGCVPVGGGTACDVPSGETVSGITSSSATLSWNPASGALSYIVQYRLVGAGSWTNVSTSNTAITVNGLNSLADYEWGVQTVCSGKSSAFSSNYYFTTLSSGGCADIYENNNTSSTARSIPVNTNLSAVVSSSSDADWFTFSTSKPNTKVKITMTGLPADYDVALYTSNLNQVGISQNSGTADETITYNFRNPRTYLIKVYGYNGAFNTSSCYTLRADVGSSNWKEISDPDGAGNTSGQISTVSVYPNPTSGNINVGFTLDRGSETTIRIMDLSGRTVLSKTIQATGGYNKFNFELSDTSKGIYFIEVRNDDNIAVRRFIVQ